MKKIASILVCVLATFIIINYGSDFIKADDENGKAPRETSTVITDYTVTRPYRYPQFYRGIYLTVESGRKMERLRRFVELAKKSYINTMVIDVQSSRISKCIIPREHVQYLLENGIHPVARVVMFPDGLKQYPLPKGLLEDRITIAREACENGFKEIQFDYIRFNDSGRNRHVSLNERYAFVEGILGQSREILKKYNVRIAADIFGRIPLNKSDLIGQRMEGLDKVVDIICPMAYPSHYTWSRKLQHDPYHTVYITSKNAAERTKQAIIVTYIQAFKMRLGPTPFDDYVAAQIRAVHDAKVGGFIMWNARQDYDIPLGVARNFYSRISRTGEKGSTAATD
ncbi:MAG: hypothetical protein JXA20_18980 [Spirochaetes bacterium]|nr:hypothetical protein [Spirochaetota bacterium]